MCTRYLIINRVSELKVHIKLTRFVQPEKIEIDANERAVNEKSPYCFFVCTTFDSFLNDLEDRCFVQLDYARIKYPQADLNCRSLRERQVSLTARLWGLSAVTGIRTLKAGISPDMPDFKAGAVPVEPSQQKRNGRDLNPQSVD